MPTRRAMSLSFTGQSHCIRRTMTSLQHELSSCSPAVFVSNYTAIQNELSNQTDTYVISEVVLDQALGGWGPRTKQHKFFN